MSIDDRKLRILQAVIKDYISTAQPVGSRTISKKYNLGISSATIRNEMSDLEEMGLLEQPHTSAGRIPSDKGYRVYVDQIMKIRRLSIAEEEKIKRMYGKKIDEIEKLIGKTSKIISELTKYTSVVLSPQLDDCRLRHIHFVPVDCNSLIAVIVTDTGVVKNTIIKTTDKITPYYLESLTKAVNERFGGITVQELNSIANSYDYKKLSYEYRILERLFPMIIDGLEEEMGGTVYAEGVSNMFNFPEYSDINRAKNFLAFMEEKEELLKIINMYKGKGVQISIGKELDNKNIEDCSLITTTYRLGDKVIGKIGIIGPTRMEYARVVGALEFLTDYINELITDLRG